jgi:anti-sigma B factor antagonist
MDFRGTIDEIGGLPTLCCDGVIDLGSVPDFRDTLQRLVTLHVGTTVVVDLDGVTALDDCGLGLLLGAAALARDGGGELVIVGSASRVADRIRHTGLADIVTVRDSVGGTSAG